MSNLRENDTKFKPASGVALDKLAQLRRKGSQKMPAVTLERLQKRAKAKWFTMSYINDLIDLNSPLKKSYTNTIYCCQTLHQKEDRLVSKYCNNRWCLVCNRIRIGKAINGYMPELMKLEDPQFLTLTIPNVKRYQLRLAIDPGSAKKYSGLFLFFFGRIKMR